MNYKLEFYEIHVWLFFFFYFSWISGLIAFLNDVIGHYVSTQFVQLPPWPMWHGAYGTISRMVTPFQA